MSNFFLQICMLASMLSYIPVSQAKHLLVFGDSLSAAYGLELEQGWVQLVANELGAEHLVSNASISGETTSGGLARLPETLLELKPDIVMLELGANDGLRGYPPADIKTNLAQMIELVRDSGAEVILTGISVPPSYGPRYIDQFRAVFEQLAEEKTVPYIDFYNEQFVNTPGLIQQDGLHPTEKGQPIIRDTVWTFFREQGFFE